MAEATAVQPEVQGGGGEAGICGGSEGVGLRFYMWGAGSLLFLLLVVVLGVLLYITRS